MTTTEKITAARKALESAESRLYDAQESRDAEAIARLSELTRERAKAYSEALESYETMTTTTERTEEYTMNVQVQTREVLAGAYRGKSANLAATLTHACWVDMNDPMATPVPLCRSVKPENMCDEYGSDIYATPTCPKCAKKDPRGKTNVLNAMLRIAR